MKHQFHYGATETKDILGLPHALLSSGLSFVSTRSVALTFVTETRVTLCWCQQTTEADRGVQVVPRLDSLYRTARHKTQDVWLKRQM